MVLIRPSWPNSGPAVTMTWSPSFRASLARHYAVSPVRKAANKLDLFFLPAAQTDRPGESTRAKVVHAQQILLHGTGICRVADKITGKERFGRIDPFAVNLNLGLKLGIKSSCMAQAGTMCSMRSRIMSSRPLMTWNHIPHEHHPFAVLRVAHGVLGIASPGRLCAKALHIQTPEPS